MPEASNSERIWAVELASSWVFGSEDKSVLQNSLRGCWNFGIANSQLGTVSDKGNPTV